MFSKTASSLIFKITKRVEVNMTTDEVPLFNLKQYEHFWIDETEIPGLNIRKKLEPSELLKQVQRQLEKDPPLLTRNFYQLPSTNEDDSGQNVRVMQWNLLAQGLSVGMDNFVKCPKQALDWDFRRLRMLEEILTVNPDVVCLQEVDHFGFLNRHLSAVGFEGFFFPKPDSPALYGPDSHGPDGCAIFYRKSKLKLVDKDTIVLKTKDRVIFTNQVAIILKLRPSNVLDDSKDFTIATTHLKAKDGWEQLRHSQCTYLLDFLQHKIGKGRLIFAGDLNAETDEAVYGACLNSKLNIKSAYAAANGKEPAYTTWKIRGHSWGNNDVCRTIDYMWHSKRSVVPVSLYEIPTEEQIGKNRLPSLNYASDHLSLAADFCLV